MILEVLGTDMSEDWWKKREQLTELLRPHELRHNKDVTTILELALWKANIHQLVCHNRAARRVRLRMRGSDVIIPGAMSFL